ncbi:MAG: PaaI family thioesterase [Methanobacteriaceae archaeon]|jgi:acyl-CoA thioesterase|nr:MAG: phenylacetic acid degradation protein [Methanobacterium sp. BRmetb2]MCC7557540.1 PaaI family thioesterase [Methanobacteriaceae archaeon]
MEKLLKYFENDNFACKNHIKLIEANKGKAKAEMVIKQGHLNSLGTVHGGAIFTLADFTFAAAANSHGNVSVAINAHISFMKAAYKGTLLAEAEEISINPKIATYTVKIKDQRGDIIAIFQGMAYRKKDKLNLTKE